MKLTKTQLRKIIREELYNEASWHLKDYHRNDQLEKQFKKLKKGYYLADKKLNFYKITKIGKWEPRLGKNDLPDGRLTIKLVRLGPKIKRGAIGKGYEAPIWYSDLAKQELTVMTKIKESVNEGQPLNSRSRNMKLTNSKLKEIIREELLNEADNLKLYVIFNRQERRSGYLPLLYRGVVLAKTKKDAKLKLKSSGVKIQTNDVAQEVDKSGLKDIISGLQLRIKQCRNDIKVLSKTVK